MKEYKNKEDFMRELRSIMDIPNNLLARIVQDSQYKEEIHAFANKFTSLREDYKNHVSKFSDEEDDFVTFILFQQAKMGELYSLGGYQATLRLREESEKSKSKENH